MSTSGGVATPESELLRAKIGLWLPELSAAGHRFVDHPRVRDLYPEYLETKHWVVRASVPLMETARTRASEMAGDPVATTVAAYFEKHIDEEVDHDEWLLEDLEALGRDRADVLRRPPSPTVAGVIGAQYYWILHYHPVALLGYTMLLEGYAPAQADVEDLMARTGYGPRVVQDDERPCRARSGPRGRAGGDDRQSRAERGTVGGAGAERDVDGARARTHVRRDGGRRGTPRAPRTTCRRRSRVSRSCGGNASTRSRNASCSSTCGMWLDSSNSSHWEPGMRSWICSTMSGVASS